MGSRLLTAGAGPALAGAIGVAFVGDVGRAATQPDCSVRRAGDSYTAAVARATADGRDVWGARLLALPHGPSYEAARTFLAPVLFSIARRGNRVTAVVDVPARAEHVRLRLRLPAGERLRSVVANGRAARLDARTGTVDLSGTRGRVAISATVRR